MIRSYGSHTSFGTSQRHCCMDGGVRAVRQIVVIPEIRYECLALRMLICGEICVNTVQVIEVQPYSLPHSSTYYILLTSRTRSFIFCHVADLHRAEGEALSCKARTFCYRLHIETGLLNTSYAVCTARPP